MKTALLYSAPVEEPLQKFKRQGNVVHETTVEVLEQMEKNLNKFIFSVFSRIEEHATTESRILT